MTQPSNIGPVDHPFVIFDPVNLGYAVHDPLEGWVFTVLLSHATRFDRKISAQRTIDTEYKAHKTELLVTPVTK